MPEEQTVPAAQPAQPAPAQPAPVAKSGDDNLMAALSYISVLSIVMLLVKKDSDFVKFHAKQGVVLFIGEVIYWFVSAFTWFLFFVWWIVGLLLLIVSIIGFIKAFSGERYRIPVVADLADKFNI